MARVILSTQQRQQGEHARVSRCARRQRAQSERAPTEAADDVAAVDSCRLEAGVQGGAAHRVSVLQPLREGSLVPVLQPFRTAGPDVWALFHPRHLRAAKVQVFVDFLTQIFGQGFNEN